MLSNTSQFKNCLRAFVAHVTRVVWFLLWYSAATFMYMGLDTNCDVLRLDIFLWFLVIPLQVTRKEQEILQNKHNVRQMSHSY